MTQPVPEEIAGFKKLRSILMLRCPKCGKASVFYTPKYRMFNVPQMHETCAHCGYRFHREPGHFDGAVIVSYGLAAIEGIVAYLLAANLIYGIDTSTRLLVALAFILVCAMWNYRLARVIWLNLFKT